MRKKTMISIRNRMWASYLIVLLVPSIIIATITYSVASNRVENELMASALESVNSADAIINQVIESKLIDISYYATLFTSDDVNKEVAEGGRIIKDKFKEYKTIHKDVLDMYIGTSTGKIVRSLDDALAADFDPRKRDWYILAFKQGAKPVISPAFRSVDGNIAVSVSQVLPDGKGVISLNLDLQKLTQMTDMKVGEEGYILILDNSKKFLVNPEGNIGEESNEEFVKEMFASDVGESSYTLEGKNYKMAFSKNELTGWRIGGSLNEEEVLSKTESIRNTAIIVVVTSILAAGVIIFLNIRSVTQPLRKLNEATTVLGKGDLTKRLDHFRQDEIGDLANNFQLMVDNLRHMVGGVMEMTDNMSASAEELSAGAEQTTRAIEHVTVAIQQVAAGSEQQLQSVEGGKENIDSMAQKVEDISGHMREVTKTMSQTMFSADHGTTTVVSAEGKIRSISQTVEELAVVIQSLSQRAEHIDGIVGVMAGIAKQTNLLALNASIEAARAGEQGRGFAVVANEVRKLAEDSSHSAEQIRELIGHVQSEMKQTASTMEEVKDKVAEGIEAVDNSGKSFTLISQSITSAAVVIQSASDAIHEVADEGIIVGQAIQHIRSLSQEVASSTETISAAAEEQLASVEEIASSSTDLSHLAEELQKLIGKFKIYEDKI
ncbi:methyl-accepting chemotaxis protein [Paenibacillus segetis]|uniref:Methyl-accepting chemotaxis protein McpB n=1 Tax=Paenibacillus segetis TaxID=1325360 RepID=A0ABQ1Y5P2_9BACL|nr:methyl-accepting chemotaxis protein [Paenibacillus segetis]GGH12549.1 methyl-accepting chemotaxis protein McpB [Paenibacillus segetis]